MAKINKVCEVALNDLVPYQNNAKLHDKTQIAKIADSIREFGFISPCLIDENNNVIAGHGRIMAARAIGMQAVPCVYVEGLSETQRRAYILADNKLTELGDWDVELVNFELSELKNLDFNIDIIGFDDIDIETFSGEKDRAGIDLPQQTYNLIIECENEQEMNEKFDLLASYGISCRISTL